MMKVIILVVLMAVTVQKSCAGSEEFMKNVAECKITEKATDADFLNVKNKVRPATKEMKCLTTCLAEKMGLISGNKISVEGAMTFVKNVPNSNEKMTQGITEILEECKGIQDSDRCEFGSKVMDCLMEGSSKRSIKIFM